MNDKKNNLIAELTTKLKAKDWFLSTQSKELINDIAGFVVDIYDKKDNAKIKTTIKKKQQKKSKLCVFAPSTKYPWHLFDIGVTHEIIIPNDRDPLTFRSLLRQGLKYYLKRKGVELPSIESNIRYKKGIAVSVYITRVKDNTNTKYKYDWESMSIGDSFVRETRVNQTRAQLQSAIHKSFYKYKSVYGDCKNQKIKCESISDNQVKATRIN